MRRLVVALALVAAPASASAQSGTIDGPPPPSDFTRPFQLDRSPYYRWNLPDVRFLLRTPHEKESPIEVIGRDELLKAGSPTMEEIARALVESRSAEDALEAVKRAKAERKNEGETK